jgi:hypothetical protein
MNPNLKSKNVPRHLRRRLEEKEARDTRRRQTQALTWMREEIESYKSGKRFPPLPRLTEQELDSQLADVSLFDMNDVLKLLALKELGYHKRASDNELLQYYDKTFVPDGDFGDVLQRNKPERGFVRIIRP